mgnify:CR=1 FL=1
MLCCHRPRIIAPLPDSTYPRPIFSCLATTRPVLCGPTFALDHTAVRAHHLRAHPYRTRLTSRPPPGDLALPSTLLPPTTHAIVAARDCHSHRAAAAQGMGSAVRTSGLSANAETPGVTAPTATLATSVATVPHLRTLRHRLLETAPSACLPTPQLPFGACWGVCMHSVALQLCVPHLLRVRWQCSRPGVK